MRNPDDKGGGSIRAIFGGIVRVIFVGGAMGLGGVKINDKDTA